MSVGSIGVGLALWKGGVDFLSGVGMTLGTMVAFMQYAGLIYMPIQELAGRFTEMQGAQAAAERIQSLLETEPEIRDSPELLIDDGKRRERSKPSSFGTCPSVTCRERPCSTASIFEWTRDRP